MNNLEIFKEIIEKPEVLIKKNDLRKIAKEYGMTKKNLIKKLNNNGYEYDKRAKGYIYIESNTNSFKKACITSDYNIDKLYEMNIMLLEKISNINTNSITKSNTDNEENIIEAETKIVTDYKKEDFKATTLRIHKEIWQDFQKNHKENHKNLTQQELHARVLEEFNAKYSY